MPHSFTIHNTQKAIIQSWGPYLIRFFHRNSNLVEKLFWCNSIVGYCITTKFCTSYESNVVISCAKFHSNHFTTIWMRVECNFHWIWITMEKLFVKWAPDQTSISPVCVGSISSFGRSKYLSRLDVHKNSVVFISVLKWKDRLPYCCSDTWGIEGCWYDRLWYLRWCGYWVLPFQH